MNRGLGATTNPLINGCALTLSVELMKKVGRCEVGLCINVLSSAQAGNLTPNHAVLEILTAWGCR